MRDNGRNDKIGKIKEIIANTQDNIVQAQELLNTQPLTGSAKKQLQHTNENRTVSLVEQRKEIDDEFNH